MKKVILGGLSAAVIFHIISTIFSGTIGSIIFSTGDPYTMSYHKYTYTGLLILCGVIVACTLFLNMKINNLKSEIYDQKKKSKYIFIGIYFYKSSSEKCCYPYRIATFFIILYRIIIPSSFCHSFRKRNA